jgi:hypothetical protein
VDTNIQISGLSSEALASYSAQFAEIATKHRQILKFTEISLRDPNCGSVLRAFTNAIQSYLKYYHSKIIYFIDMKNMWNVTPTSLYAQLKPYMDQIKYGNKFY